MKFTKGKTLNQSISKIAGQIFLKLRIQVVLVSIFKSYVALMACKFFPCPAGVKIPVGIVSKMWVVPDANFQPSPVKYIVIVNKRVS